jgi:hypothetical protein
MWQSTIQAPTILQHSVSKILPYLSQYLARWGRFDEMEQGMVKLGVQALMATLDKVQPHWISLKSSVILGSPRVRILSQYRCGTEIPEMEHIVHKVQRHDRNGKMPCARALIDHGAISILLAPTLLKPLRISPEVVHITTIGLN